LRSLGFNSKKAHGKQPAIGGLEFIVLSAASISIITIYIGGIKRQIQNIYERTLAELLLTSLSLTCAVAYTIFAWLLLFE
jgi:hypothetical protein